MASSFEVEMLLIASPKAISVKRRIKRKCRMSTTTSMMILIKYPVDWKILKKYRNLSQSTKVHVDYKHASKVGAPLLSNTPSAAKGKKKLRMMGGIKSK